jgi:hypothetical protein
MQDIPFDIKKRGPSSRVLQELIRQAPAEAQIAQQRDTPARDRVPRGRQCFSLKFRRF